MKYILYAIPAFFMLISLEVLIDKLKKTGYYRLNDTVTNLSLGIGSQITSIFLKVLTLGTYHYIYTNYRLIEHIPNTWYLFILLFLGVDFFYYWFHRLTHEIGVLWGAHVVHHQSEEYNFSVALRQSWSQAAFSWLFYLPLAFIGFSTETFIVVAAIQLLYQFWIHTKLINRMPAAFEYIFNTPSHHRVHHGQNPLYIDRNHGGTLIVFDRIFGTFQEELEEVVYGITKPANSWNPLWLNIDYYYDWWHTFRGAKGISNKLKVFYKAPGWSPETDTIAMFDRENIKKFDTSIAPIFNYYIIFNVVLLLVFSSFFLKLSEENFFKELLFVRVLICLVVIYFTVSLSAILERKNWAFFMEIGRLIIFPMSIACLLQLLQSAFFLPIVFFSVIISILSFAFLVVNNRAAKRHD